MSDQSPLSVLHRLAYPAMTRLSRATHRWCLQAKWGARSHQLELTKFHTSMNWLAS